MANNQPIIIFAPKCIDRNNSTSFIRVFNFVFALSGKQKPHYHLAFQKVEKCDVTGVLLIYKVLEFSVSNQCFNAPTHDIAYNDYLKEYISEYGFSDLIKSLMNTPNSIDLRPYKKLKVSSDERVLIAPIALIRDDSSHSLDIIKTQYVPIISSFYSDDKIQQMILGVFTEVMHNFWAHATVDSKSIIVGYGTKQYFEIVCCDNGSGIDGTMKERFSSNDPKRLICKAMENGVTSKVNTSHMGYGLWYINEVVSRSKGTLLIISNSVIYQNDRGKIRVQNAPFWKGCVVSVKLPLVLPVSISDISVCSNQEVKINFV